MILRKNIFILAVVPLAIFLGSLYGMAGEERNRPDGKVLTVGELPQFRISKGEVLYARYCAFCHGETGAGDGLNAYSIPVKPRNLNDRTALAQGTDEELGTVIRSGGPSLGMSKYMPAFGRTLSAVKIKYLVDFIRAGQEEGKSR